MNPRNFFAELKRRNVYKVAVAYAVVAWLLIQLASILFPTFEAPGWVMKVFVALVARGFPLALILAWAVELTPEGIKRADEVPPEQSITRTTGRKLNVAIIAVLAAAVALLLFDRFRPKRQASADANTVKSIAVLPFENLSRDPDNAYFATGVQDEILTRLAKVSELKVISRTSTQQYQSKPGNLREIAQQLGVAHIVEGSVQRAGDSVRVNVQLIKADTDAHLWAETYDRKLSEIFQVQSDIAFRIADALEAKLTGRERQQIASAATDNPRAYEAYLRGLAIDGRGPDSAAARDAYREAVQLDPNFAAAWAALANRESFDYFQHTGTPEQLSRARQAMETALRLAPDASESHAAASSFYYYCLQDFDRALEYAAEARRRGPNNAHVILLTALVKRRQGNFDEANQLLHEAAKLDPRNNDIWLNLARSHRGARRFSEALAYFDRALAVTPAEPDIIGEKTATLLASGDLDTAEQLLKGVAMSRDSIALRSYTVLLIYRRDFARATALIEEVMRDADPQSVDVIFPRILLGGIEILLGNEASGRKILQEAEVSVQERRRSGDRSIWLQDDLIMLLALLGDRDGVEREAAELVRRTQKDKWRFPMSQEVQARAYALLGDAARATAIVEELLPKTYHHSLTTADLRLHPEWDKIRADPRFQKLVDDAEGAVKPQPGK